MYYAVRCGHIPGVYNTWEDCRKQIAGFSNAIFRKFENLEDAVEFVKEKDDTTHTVSIERNKINTGLLLNYAYADGSYNPKSGFYGYGGFLVVKDPKLDKDGLPVIDEETNEIICNDIKTYVVHGSCGDDEMTSMKNVAGEISGVKAILKKAMELNLKELTIIYDYLGIEMWANGTWNCNKVGTMIYQDYCKEIQTKIKLQFTKVKSHIGVPGNELADRIAKYTVGLETIENIEKLDEKIAKELKT